MKTLIYENTFIVKTILFSTFFACCVFAINAYFFEYQGVFYNPTKLISSCTFLFLTILGVRYTFNLDTYTAYYLRDLVGFYCVLLVITLMTNAVQLTPFPPIDANIVAFERYLGINSLDLIIWANSHPWFTIILRFAYATINFQIALLPIFAIFLCLREELYEYLILMLITMLLGFGFYYFFPTTAPASVFGSQHFLDSQLATGLKFTQIHQYIPPKSEGGGLIALPSYHVIWAWLLVYMLRKNKIAMFILVPLNILLAISCVLLGWHYVIDIFGSIIVLIIAHVILRLHKKNITKPYL